MLILLLRIGFVLLATLIGMTSGQFFYHGIYDGHLPPWFGGAMGFGIAVTLIAAEQGFRRRFARSVVAFLVGLASGLALTCLLLSVLRLVLQDSDLYRNLDLPIALVTVYLVLITVLRNIDRWRVVIPFVEFRSEQFDGSAAVVDAAILSDGRLAALLKTGLFAQRVLVHRKVLIAIESDAGSVDVLTHVRATRALEGLKELRALGMPQVEIVETEIPNVSNISDLLVRLCRLEGARLLAGERDLVRRAEAEGVSVIDLYSLTVTLAPTVRPGETLSIRIDKAGEGRDQGIGFLDDGSMVVVNGAAPHIGQAINVTVLRIHTTANGRMVFAEAVK